MNRAAATGAFALMCLALAADTPAGQLPAATFKSEVTGVVVDVVVRDRRGQLVTNLSVEEFAVSEDGVPQTVATFEARGNPGRTSAPLPHSGKGTSAPGSPRASPPQPAVIVLIFDRLSLPAQRAALLASEKFVGSGAQAADYIGVVRIDRDIEVLTSFTRDAVVLRRALQTLGGSASTSFVDSSQRIRELSRQVAGSPPGGGAGVGAEAPSDAVAAGRLGGIELAMKTMELRMLQGEERMDRELQGRSTLGGLLGLVSALELMPGRKTVLFFSEGLAIPERVHGLFRSVIDTANRVNAAVYTVDTAGLRARSGQMATAEDVNMQGRTSFDRGAGIALRELERNEDALRRDPEVGLTILAEQTGAAAIRDTNDIDRAFTRVVEDQRGHYLLTYFPTNPGYDGRFRQIRVEVRRPRHTVQARPGYLAVRPSGGLPILSYEAAPLGVLDGPRAPNAFPVRARGFVFPVVGVQRSRVVCFVQVPTSVLTFTELDGRFVAEVVVLARLRDASGRVLAKMSQPYRFDGPLADVDRAKRVEVLFFRQPELVPGTYTLETIAYDVQAEKASVRIASIEVPGAVPGTPPDQVLLVGTPFVVQRAEKVAAADRDAQNPLYFGDVLLYPNLGEPISKAATSELSFAFTVQPPKNTTATAKLSLVHSGAVVAELPLPLAEPDSLGTVHQVSRLPLAPIPPGTFELRITVDAGGKSVTGRVPFSIGA